MIINLYFDNKYFYWANTLVRSIKVHEPSTKIHFHTYNLSDEQVKELESYSNTAYVDNAKLKFDPEIADAYNNHLNKDDPLRFQITCRKGEFLLKSMKRFPDEDLFIVMDVDMVVIRCLDDLRNQMKGNDVGVIRSGKRKIAGGFIIVRPTEKGKYFLTLFDKLVMQDRLYLCKDQKTLAKVYEKSHKKIKFLQLGRGYLDHSSGEEAYIWSAHKSKFGTKIERYKKYLEYVEKMEKKNAK